MDLIANVICYVYLTSTHFNCGDIGCVSLAPKQRTLLPPAYTDHMTGVLSRCNRAKMAQQYLHRRDRRTSVVRLSGEPSCDPNQSSAPWVIGYNQLLLTL